MSRLRDLVQGIEGAIECYDWCVQIDLDYDALLEAAQDYTDSDPRVEAFEQIYWALKTSKRIELAGQDMPHFSEGDRFVLAVIATHVGNAHKACATNKETGT